MRTPDKGRLAEEGRAVFSVYAQPGCTPGRAAMQTGRIPNRSGMTTVAFQGQGGGLAAAEWTLASVLKEAGYDTYFTGKWHLGAADYADRKSLVSVNSESVRVDVGGRRILHTKTK